MAHMAHGKWVPTGSPTPLLPVAPTTSCTAATHVSIEQVSFFFKKLVFVCGMCICVHMLNMHAHYGNL